MVSLCHRTYYDLLFIIYYNILFISYILCGCALYTSYLLVFVIFSWLLGDYRFTVEPTAAATAVQGHERNKKKKKNNNRSILFWFQIFERVSPQWNFVSCEKTKFGFIRSSWKLRRRRWCRSLCGIWYGDEWRRSTKTRDRDSHGNISAGRRVSSAIVVLFHFRHNLLSLHNTSVPGSPHGPPHTFPPWTSSFLLAFFTTLNFDTRYPRRRIYRFFFTPPRA